MTQKRSRSFQDKMMLTFDHIDPDLTLPIAVAIIWEKPSGSAETLRTLKVLPF